LLVGGRVRVRIYFDEEEGGKRRRGDNDKIGIL
jgi:hypothetical protein